MDRIIKLGADLLNNKIPNNFEFENVSCCLKDNLRKTKEINEAEFVKISYEIFNEFIKYDFVICSNCGKKVELK